MNSGLNILVTGSNGFVGSNLMWLLESMGHYVIGIDKSARCNGRKHPNTLEQDILDIKRLKNITSPIDLIIHAAAAKHDFGITKEEYFLDNVEATKAIKDFALAKSVKKIVYYSTVSAYGHPEKPCDESGLIIPNTEYGATKLQGEYPLIDWVNTESDRKLIILRPTVIYGPRNFANLYNFIDFRYRFPWLMLGKGTHIKSIVSLSNLLDMTIFGINNCKNSISIYNCIDKEYITLNELRKLIDKYLKIGSPKIFISSESLFIRFTGKIFDFLGDKLNIDFPINSDRINKFDTPTHYFSEKIRDDGYFQRNTIEDEIKKTVEWYLEYKEKIT